MWGPAPWFTPQPPAISPRYNRIQSTSQLRKHHWALPDSVRLVTNRTDHGLLDTTHVRALCDIPSSSHQCPAASPSLPHPGPSWCVPACWLFFFCESFHAFLKRWAVHIVWIHYIPSGDVHASCLIVRNASSSDVSTLDPERSIFHFLIRDTFRILI